jgi:hypothetical protein
MIKNAIFSSTCTYLTSDAARAPGTAAAVNNTAAPPTRTTPLPYEWLKTAGNDISE